MSNNNHYKYECYKITSGRYKGIMITRVPPSHLIHMININHPDAAQARKELERRGTIIPDIDVSGHAIDRASLRCMEIYKKSKKKDEGFYAWLIRMSQSALKNGTKDGGKILYKGMKFFFSTDTQWPVLKSVMVSRKYEMRKRNKKNGFNKK